MRVLFILSFLVYYNGTCFCQTNNNSGLTDAKTRTTSNLQFIHQNESYKNSIARIKRERSEMYKNNTSIDSCKDYFMKQFEYVVFPKWIGTAWDYNGYTNTPGADKLIACGYFVSTTLKHMGFNWNRYDLAKMYSTDIVDKSCEEIIDIKDISSLEKHIYSKPNNLYIVGLDSHVGFILKNDQGAFFIHSNYYGAVGPQKENLLDSPALNDSQRFYLGTLLTEKTIKKWLTNELYSF